MQTTRMLASALFCLVACVASCAQIAGLEDSTPFDDAGATPDTSEGDASGSGGRGGSGGGGGAAGNSTVDAAADGGAEAGCTGLLCKGVCVANDVHNCGACGHDCTL